MIAALILAGRGTEGLGEQWLALRGAGLDPLRIALRRGDGTTAAASGLARENFVVDRARPGSPFTALQAGLRALLAADDWDAVAIQPAAAAPPHPSVVLALLARLAEGDAGVVRPAHRGKAGFPVLLARDAASALAGFRARGATLDAVLAALEEAGAAERVEAYTAEVLGGRVRSRTGRRK